MGMRPILIAMLVLLMVSSPAEAGRRRDEKGDTYKLDIETVIIQHDSNARGRQFIVFRLDMYDDFSNSQLRRNSENSMYSVAIRFETHSGRPCDRNLQIYLTWRDGKPVPGARITGPPDYRKWDGGNSVHGYPRAWRPDQDSVAVRFPESMLRKKGVSRFGWGLRTVSHDEPRNTLYFDYSPQGKLAWEQS